MNKIMLSSLFLAVGLLASVKVQAEYLFIEKVPLDGFGVEATTSKVLVCPTTDAFKIGSEIYCGKLAPGSVKHVGYLFDQETYSKLQTTDKAKVDFDDMLGKLKDELKKIKEDLKKEIKAEMQKEQLAEKTTKKSSPKK